MSHMSRRFEGKVALITGGGTGIGAATARRLAAEGARVTLAGRRKQLLEEVATGLDAESAMVVAGDAASTVDANAMVRQTVDRFGRLDVLVANAGGLGGGLAGEIDDESWQLAITSNLDTAFRAARAALPELVRSNGNIVFVSSIAGLAASPETAGYVTTKHALIGLTRSVARDYGPSGVRANAVCPGWVRTPMADEEMTALQDLHGITRDEAYALATKDTPLRRPAEPDEIAAVIAFIASPEAAVMTGTVLVADSGASCVDLPTLAFAL